MDQPALLETDKRAKEIEQEYLSSLADLNVNSKPLINMLTILAEENLEYAQIIVSAVEKHLAKVEPDVKLPILYLVDSIVKNVGKQYQSLFSQVIVHMFCGVFETVNEKIREKMFGLRQTWNEVFPQSKLYAIDIKINSMDPGWPITAQLKPKIHVNPMFLKAAGPDATMQQQLKDKHRELLELQKRKLELELFATRRHIEEQEKQMQLRTASVAKEPPPEVVRKVLENSGNIGLPPMMSVTGGGLLSTAIPPPGVVAKTRIAPVPQSMINMVKTRDPRLAKQQAVAQLVTPAHAGTGMAGAHTNLGAMSVPPPAIVPVLTMEAPNPVAPKVSVKDRLGARVRRLEPSGGSRSEAMDFEDNGRIKKHSSSSSSSSQKSRHDHDTKSRKDRKEHSSSSSSSSSKSGAARGKLSSTSRPGSGSGSEKRKQRTHSNSDGSPQDRKSPHSSPGKKKISSTTDKSNHHSSDGPAKAAEKSRSESKGSPTNAGKAQASRQARSSSTDSSKRQDHATSGEHHHQSVAGTEAQDIDLRFSFPEKRMKLDESLPEPDRRSVDADEKVPMGGRKASEVKNITSATDEEEAVSAMIAKDIDLRSIPLHLMPSKRVAQDLDIELSRAPKDVPVIRVVDDVGDSDEYSAGKKRSSTNKSDEPTAKKSKAEMLDALFGNEDVDLRKLPIGGTLLEAPTSMHSVEGQDASFPKLDNLLDAPRSPLHEKNGGNRMDIVRAKLSEASKNQEKDKLGRPLLYNKLPDDPIERRRSISSLAKPGDLDLRHLPPHHHAGGALEQDDEDSSMDSMNSNIKTIITQAQEQMDKGEITPEQYNILMKQVIQLNETQKIRQAQRIEHGKQQQQQQQQQHHPQQEPPIIRIDDNGSLSGEDDVIVTSVTPASGSTSVGSVVNDFRGKIHPLVDGGGGGPPLGKPFEMPFVGTGVVPLTSVPPPDIRSQRDPRRQRESKWNRVEPNANSSWPNRPGVPPPPVVGGPLAGVVPPVMVPGGIRTGPPMAAVPSPWEKAPFPVASGMPRYTAPPMLPPIGIVAGQGANGQSGPMLMPPAMAKINDSVRTINIDGIQREIRFYEETAVIFMSWDEPKEIGFQKGARMVVVDGRETFELGFNETYKSVSIDNKVYQMRLGAPTRELYIDDSWYECYFGDAPTSIFLDGKLRIFKIAGPAPQVKIGGNRNDLVAGKINMIVDAEYIIPVFLDCKVQTFEINGQAHTLQFADFLLTVVIDELPYPVDFGKLPKVYRLRGRDYYIRFTSLPNNVQPGNVYIRDMIRTPLYRDLRTPPKDPGALVPPPANSTNQPFAPAGLGVPPPALGGAFSGGGGGGGGINNNNHPAALGGPGSVPSHPPPTASNKTAGLDYLTSNAVGSSSVPGGGYRVEADEKAPPSTSSGGSNGANSSSSAGIPLLANINVEELYKKIVAAGIITKLGSNPATAGGATASSGEADGGRSLTAKNSKDDPTAAAGGKGKVGKESKPAVPAIDPVLLDKPETLKKRQSAIVHQLFSGMQCSSCGVRFPPEQTMKYSQHLDWHFRQNRRDRDSARKAHSRKWYYDVSDWIQYEEIEDLEEREKNWFETQQTEQGDPMKKGSSGGGGGGGGLGGGGGAGAGDGGGDDSGPNGGGSPQPSCPAGSDEDDRQCHMCHEVFEQFYNEETEDWHLKCAIRVDGSTYHPLCYEDYKASLTMSETTLGNNTTTDGGVDGSLDESRKTDGSMETGDGDGDSEDGAGDGDESVGAAEEGEGSTRGTPRKKATKLGKDGDVKEDDDDDDVIVLPAVEPVVEEILDDEVEEPNGGDTATEDAILPDELSATKSPIARQPEFQERQIDEDLFIQEPNIEVTDLDEIEDRPVSDTAHLTDAGDGSSSLSSLLRVKIKEEPKEDDEVDEEDALFEDVGTIESSLLEINDEQRSPRTEATNVAEDMYEDVIVEGSPSPATTETSNQMAVAPKPSLDGNVELQDAPQAAVLVPNRIRINITKSKATTAPNQGTGVGGGQGAANEGDTVGGGEGGGAIVNTNFNENSHGAEAVTTDATEEGSRAGPSGMFDELSNDAVGSWGDEGDQNGINNLRTAAAAAVPAEVAFEETTNVAYEQKPALAGIEFNRCPRVTSGSEASGLCSIM
uniref:Pre-mRNA cleavage complex 2 protein Pcf11 n=1 Tax=Anopheles atroparvus TaxID=41427 RepID=A0AAG5D028_ANOAO